MNSPVHQRSMKQYYTARIVMNSVETLECLEVGRHRFKESKDRGDCGDSLLLSTDTYVALTAQTCDLALDHVTVLQVPTVVGPVARR